MDVGAGQVKVVRTKLLFVVLYFSGSSQKDKEGFLLNEKYNIYYIFIYYILYMYLYYISFFNSILCCF